MKKRFFHRIALSALLLFFGALKVSAQSTETLITLQIHFDFQAGGKLLPAGEYTFKRIVNSPGVLLIEGSDLKTGIAFSTFSGWSEEPVQTSLIFKEYGGKRFLSEVKIAQRGFKYSLAKSKAEHELAQTMAARVIRATPTDRLLRYQAQAEG